MNNDMNEGAEFLYRQFLSWLEPEQSIKPSSGEPDFNWSSTIGVMSYLEIDGLDPFEGEEEELFASSDFEIDEFTQTPQLFTMGEIPIVQRRFHKLLKRKLYAQIQQKPPLFPWEAGLMDYALDYNEELVANISNQLWLPQVVGILPVNIPETVLDRLLDACKEALGFLRPQGNKMVKAVSTLFPNYSQRLNEIAGRIRLSPSLAPTRLSQQEQQHQRQQLAAVLPKDYEAATTEQQMAIALLVAKDLLDTLTFNLTPRQNTIERLWETTTGSVHLIVDYQPATGNDLFSRGPLRVRVQLPEGGFLILKKANGESITTERTYPGHLSVELSDWEPEQIYLLEVRPVNSSQRSLLFAITCR